MTNSREDDAKLLNQGVSVSPVVSINGTDATKYIEKFSFGEKPQDPDARYVPSIISGYGFVAWS